jgi:uncharacterized protein YjbJ (UPF0337 family)
MRLLLPVKYQVGVRNARSCFNQPRGIAFVPAISKRVAQQQKLQRNDAQCSAFSYRMPRGDVLTRLQPSNNKEFAMNWDRVEGNWKQITGKVKEQWGKLTDDDLAQINGNREQLEGKIQARYGYAKDQVKKDVDDWIGRM